MDFQPEKESWDSYIERLEHFFTATNMLDDDKKVFTLIHQNGPSLYTLLKELTFPKNPTLMSYDDIKLIFKRHYVGAKSIFYERKAFYGAQMKRNESASEWHRRLRSLIVNCDFGDFVEDILVDKFVTGFQGKVLHRLYEQTESLNMQQALEIAQRHENSSNSVDEAKGYTERKPSETRQKTQEPPFEQKQQRPNKNVQQQQHNNQPQPQQQQQVRNVPTCYKCGKLGHYANVCRSRVPQSNQEAGCVYVGSQPRQQLRTNVPTCNKCGKKGHNANECRSRANDSECCIS